jgi:hypothetical protein
MTELAKAKLLLEGAKIVSIELGEEGGGIVIELDTGTRITAGERDPHDEDGAVNGYAAAMIQHSRGHFTLGTQGE